MDTDENIPKECFCVNFNEFGVLKMRNILNVTVYISQINRLKSTVRNIHDIFNSRF